MTDLNITSPSDSYAEDTPHKDGERGALILGIRNDTPGSLVDTDGDRAPFQFDASGRLRVASTSSVTLSASQGEGVVDSSTLRVTIGTDDTIMSLMGTNITSIASWQADHGSSTGLTTGVLNMYEAKAYDGAALPNSVTEGDAIRAAGTLSGVAYTLIVNKDGSLAAIPIADDAADSGGSLKTGGVYNVTESTLDDGDRGDTQMDAEGYTKTRAKAYDTSSQADKSAEVAPVYTHNVGDTLAEVTDETSATNYYYLDSAGYLNWGFQADTSGATPTDTLTITIEASFQDDGTAQASASYQDVTNILAAVANWVDVDVMLFVDTVMQPKFWRIKTVTAGGSNDADYTLYTRRY